MNKLKGITPKKDAEKKEDGYTMTDEDMLAVMESKTPRKYLGEVKDYARLKGITVSAALETTFIKTHLSTLSEEDTTAHAANMGKSSGGMKKVTGSSLLERARSTGELPSTDEGMRELTKARLGIK